MITIVPQTSLKGEGKMYTLDATDLKILEFLQENARASLKEIADRVFLSSTSVSTRLERLEKEGIVTGFYAQIDPIALGYYTKAFINLEVDPVQKKEFYPYVESCNNVVECNCVTGDYSMLIEVIFKTTIELDRFIGELQKFGKTKTQIVFSTSVEHRNNFLFESE